MRFEAEIECRSCSGTGLYMGAAERGGAAVVCFTCKGSGRELFCLEYQPFKARRARDDVKRVFARTCGFVHAADDVNGIPFSQGGATYAEWLNGAEPKPVKSLYCPFLWSEQQMQHSDHAAHPHYRDHCSRGTSAGGFISKCTFFPQKAECWRRFEELTKKAGGRT